MKLIKKTNINCDFTKIRSEVLSLLEKYPFSSSHNQISLTGFTPEDSPYRCLGKLSDMNNELYGCSESDMNKILLITKGTYLEQYLKEIPFSFGRVRVMQIKPKQCYTFHIDNNFRYHLAIDSNPDSFIVFKEPNHQMINIPADGYLYQMNGFYKHSAMNGGDKPRIHLVISSDKKYLED